MAGLALIGVVGETYFRLRVPFMESNILFRLLHRADDDQRQVRRAVRRPAAPAGGATDASVQAVIEEAVLRLTRALRKETGIPYLCLAGGVALNCVANGKVLRDGQFDDLWIQPAAGDAGGTLGAALTASHRLFGEPRQPRKDRSVDVVRGGGGAMHGAFLGPAFSLDQVRRALDAAGARYETLADDALIDTAAEALAAGEAVGWFQGRMEFGPRALGNRSILGDARSPTMQKTLNLKVKHRESFRPFAPSVLREDVADWFELDRDSPYMLLLADVRAERRKRRKRCSASTG